MVSFLVEMLAYPSKVHTVRRRVSEIADRGLVETSTQMFQLRSRATPVNRAKLIPTQGKALVSYESLGCS